LNLPAEYSNKSWWNRLNNVCYSPSNEDDAMEMTVSSKEFELDRRLEELAALILAGEASDDHRREHERLSKARSRRLESNSYTRLLRSGYGGSSRLISAFKS
jgi:hypothetical protein